jgi:flagellar basal-body rod modification protein FlgD
MTVTATSSSTSAPTVSSDQTGFNGLSSENFLQMMIVQLKNQDPLQPTGNEELLNQISQMRSLQSNIELSDVLKSASSQQQLTSAASLIGKAVSGTVTGSDGNSQTVQGVVDRAFVRAGDAYVGVGTQEIPVKNVTDVQ